MKIHIRSDSVVIEGYVNAVERNSKILRSRMGRFIERICKGAFFNALERAEDVHCLVDHEWDRDVGSTSQGNLELNEDNIGLHARAEITDPQTIQDARDGNLVGWSFGFYDTPDGVERSVDQDTGLPLRKVKDMILKEVSIITKKKNPAYDGTLIMARSDDEADLYGETFIERDIDFIDEMDVREDEETKADEEIRDEQQPKQEEHPEAIDPIDYSLYESMISEMKGA